MKMPKLYRLARSPLTQHDLERSKIAQFRLLCPALFHSALGTTKKWRGTVKKFFRRYAPEIVPLHFQITSGATDCEMFLYMYTLH